MDDAIKVLSMAMIVVTFGGLFALGFAIVCRTLNWSPVNITVHQTIYKPEEDE
jgi:hypothetical protein